MTTAISRRAAWWSTSRAGSTRSRRRASPAGSPSTRLAPQRRPGSPRSLTRAWAASPTSSRRRNCAR
eukprot:130545-Pyramimonas_sp.AAC.1